MANLSKSARALPTTGRVTILVIDDDLALRMILSFSLTALGYLVLVAKNGEEALQITHGHPEVRLIVLDVVMTGLSGKKFAAQLRTRLPKVSILFCSGHPAAVMSHHDIDLQCEHFLQKPFGPPQLKQKLEELLSIR
jgi:two-component system, cell cycle sensor histidine kinase and response regulator CckA